MMHSNDLVPDDLVNDPSFRDWVYHGTGNNYWTQWISGHPDRKQTAEQARQILLTIRGELELLPAEEVQEEVDSLLEKIRKPLRNSPAGKSIYPSWWKMAAASLVAAAGLGIFLYLNNPLVTRNTELPARETVRVIENGQLDISNESQEQQLVNLPDGSTVILQPSSSITFPKKFDEKERVVHLKGEAYFEVKKDADHPFLVYAGEMLTRVIGTSFSIRAYESDRTVSVKVKTGRVSVSAVESESQATTPEMKKEIILEPDQAAVLNRGDKVISLRTAPDRETEEEIAIEPNLFDFRRTSVPAALETISKAYNIRIVYDAELLRNCTITASLGDEPLLDKLTILCEVIGASYQISDKVIYIGKSNCGTKIVNP